MSSIEKTLEGTEKAGNYKKLSCKLTVINWENLSIVHNYHVKTVDADGDFLKEEGSGNYQINPEDFDKWITQEMKDAVLATILKQYQDSQKAEL